jgi:hypothetical protein
MIPSAPFDPILESTGASHFVRAGDSNWISVLEQARIRCESVAIGIDRRGARTLLRMTPGTTLSSRNTRKTLRSMAMRVADKYAVWPSLDQPRLVYRTLILGWWLQRAGVIGGGGGSAVKQRLARSLIVSPVLAAAHPSEVWIVNP